MTGRPITPSWEEVLASFEATTVRSEALLSGTGGIERAPADGIATYDVAALSMPPLPEHLAPRADAIRVRQARLAEQLQLAMVGVRRQTHLAVEAGPAVRRPVFVDRRA